MQKDRYTDRQTEIVQSIPVMEIKALKRLLAANKLTALLVITNSES